MFDFLFRRQSKFKEQPSPENRQVAERTAQKEDARQAALVQAAALAGDESASVAFILACPFADARLKAAECIQSQQALEQVHDAMRNVDRRVSKLMQVRLDVLKQRKKLKQAAFACIDVALQLARESHLTPSQVADLDRNWQVLREVDAELQITFDRARAEIADRLAVQMALQRTVMDALARLRQVAALPEELPPHELSRILDSLAAEIAECVSSRELPSLPRNLLPAFEEEFKKLKILQDAHEKRLRIISERHGMLERWENMSPESLDRNEIEREWHSMSQLSEADMASLRIRMDALLRRASDRDNKKPERNKEQKPDHNKERSAAPDAMSAFGDVLGSMEQALQQGALNLAAEHAETLSSLVAGDRNVDRSLAERVNQARSELKRLQDWARWSGRVSREEMIRSIEELPALSLSMEDLANRVIEARKMWKKLDDVSGSAPKMLWDQFDAACNAAYAPVAERNRKMAQERARNAESAQALIVQVREFTSGFNLDQSEDNAANDWKSVASFYRRIRQAWNQLGAIERKERRRLDAEFEQAISSLQQPLERQWQMEAARREQLINAIRALDPKSRSAVDAVRRIQEQWQGRARSMPLDMREEQNLWKRFREACDTLFTQRKNLVDAADEARRQNLQAKEALCARVEAALDEPLKSIPDLLAEFNASWNEIGPEPNSAHGAVHKRYRSAVTALEKRLEAAESTARLASHQTLLEKLALCRAAEAAITGKGDADATGWSIHWQVLPQLNATQEAMLRSRFDDAIAALEEDNSLYAAMLEANRAQLLEDLLRLEILLGLESPQEFLQERMKVQVEALQDSLAGNKIPSNVGRIDVLLSMPALANEQEAARIADILRAAFSAGQ